MASHQECLDQQKAANPGKLRPVIYGLALPKTLFPARRQNHFNRKSAELERHSLIG
jgi:hypothetical protein